jgi:hypothetical protein
MLNKETNLFDIFENIVIHSMDEHIKITLPEIVLNPIGERFDCFDYSIFDHYYVDQCVGVCGDDYYGHIYYPVKRGYLKVEFSC